MNTLTRRRFLIASGTAGVAAAAAGAGLVGWHTLAQRATADPLPAGTPGFWSSSRCTAATTG